MGDSPTKEQLAEHVKSTLKKGKVRKKVNLSLFEKCGFKCRFYEILHTKMSKKKEPYKPLKNPLKTLKKPLKTLKNPKVL